MRTPRSAIVCFLLLAAACVQYGTAHSEGAASPEPLDRFPQATVEIATPDARTHRFSVWLADTDSHREQGLMFVTQMPENRGMLFLFPRTERVAFWMKNTFIPLDMVFIRADGIVDSVAENTTPQSLNSIYSKGEVNRVLEINGGLAKRLGIRAGARLTRPGTGS